MAKITQGHQFIIEVGSLGTQGQILNVFSPVSPAPSSQLILPRVLRASTRIQALTEHLHAHVPPLSRLGWRSQTLQKPWAASWQMASFLHHEVSVSLSCPSVSSHHWPERDCHPLQSLWHQVTRDLLHQPKHYFFSSVNSSLGSGFPDCEIFAPNVNSLERATKTPAWGVPKPLNLVTPATCLIWLGEESCHRELLQ